MREAWWMKTETLHCVRRRCALHIDNRSQDKAGTCEENVMVCRLQLYINEMLMHCTYCTEEGQRCRFFFPFELWHMPCSPIKPLQQSTLGTLIQPAAKQWNDFLHNCTALAPRPNPSAICSVLRSELFDRWKHHSSVSIFSRMSLWCEGKMGVKLVPHAVFQALPSAGQPLEQCPTGCTSSED